MPAQARNSFSFSGRESGEVSEAPRFEESWARKKDLHVAVAISILAVHQTKNWIEFL